MRLAVLALVLMGTLALAQEKTVDQGRLHIRAGSARREAVREQLHRCATANLAATAPVLAGERFTKTFSDATLQTVFTTIKTTMPRNAPGSLSDPEYVDLVAHLLKINNYADGMNELGVADLTAIKIPGQTGNLDLRSYGRRLPGAERSGLDVEPRHRAHSYARTRRAER
jgi:hypothetical protein